MLTAAFLTLAAIIILTAGKGLGEGISRLMGGAALAGALAIELSGLKFAVFPGLAEDPLGKGLSVVILVLALTAWVVALSPPSASRVFAHEGFCALLLSVAGMILLVRATDLVVLFISLELTALPLYALAAWRADRQGTEAGIKYFLIGGAASGAMAMGIALLFSLAGSVGFSDIAAAADVNRFNPTLLFGLVLVLSALGVKMAAVPFQMWLPDVYQAAHPSYTAILAGVAKAAGFGVLIRFLSPGLFPPGMFVVPVSVLAVITMTIGNLAALSQTNLRRLLAYSSVAQAGYALIGVAVGTKAGLGASVFYILIYGPLVILAFGLLAWWEEKGPGPAGIDDLRGSLWTRSSAGLLWMVVMLALAGIPPFIGFPGKFALFDSAVEAGRWWLALVGAVNSVLAAAYYLRVVVVLFASSEKGKVPPGPSLPAVALGLLMIIFGLFPQSLIALAASMVTGR